MKRVLMIFILFGTVFLFATACTNSKNESLKQNNTESNEIGYSSQVIFDGGQNIDEGAATEDESETESVVNNMEIDMRTSKLYYDTGIVMSDDVSDFTVEIDGSVFKLPIPYEEIVKAGWTIKESEYYSSEDMLKAGGQKFCELVRGDKVLDVYFINMSHDTKPLKECTIGSFEINRVLHGDMIHQNISVKMAGGIERFVTTRADIERILGQPSSVYGEGSDQSITYYPSEDSCIKFRFDENYVMNGLILENFVALPSDTEGSHTVKPDFLDDYVIPTELGDNIFSNVVEWYGDLYRLPAPISAFLDYGWEVSECRVETLDSQQYYGGVLYLQRDDVTRGLNLYNASDKQALAMDCVVPELYDAVLSRTDMVLSGGIQVGSSLDEVQAIPGQEPPIEADKEYWFNFYSSDNNYLIKIIVSKETNTVTQIEATCMEWGRNIENVTN